MKKNFQFICLITLLFSSALIASPALAEGMGCAAWLKPVTLDGSGCLIAQDCLASGCSTNLSGVFITIINFSRLILSLTGMAVLLMFMYGGALWILAGGAQERIQKGKAAMEAAAIGLIIVLTAWLIVNFTITTLTGGKGIFGGGAENWTTEPTEQSQTE